MTPDTLGASRTPTASLAQALRAVSDHLATVYADVAVLEEWLRATAEHDAQAAYRLVEHLDALSAVLADVGARAESLETRLESIERRTAQQVSLLQAAVKQRLCALEHRGSGFPHDR